MNNTKPVVAETSDGTLRCEDIDAEAIDVCSDVLVYGISTFLEVVGTCVPPATARSLYRQFADDVADDGTMRLEGGEADDAREQFLAEVEQSSWEHDDLRRKDVRRAVAMIDNLTIFQFAGVLRRLGGLSIYPVTPRRDIFTEAENDSKPRPRRPQNWPTDAQLADIRENHPELLEPLFAALLAVPTVAVPADDDAGTVPPK